MSGDSYQFRPHKLALPSGRCQTQPVVVALCGSFNPVHNTHLALYEAAKKRLLSEDPCAQPSGESPLVSTRAGYEVLGGFLSPVSDAYGKAGLAPFAQRLGVLEAALADHPSLEVDCWEGLQPTYTRTLLVLSHLEDTVQDWARGVVATQCAHADRSADGAPVRVVFACGADLFESFFKPKCWPLSLLERLLNRFQLVIVGRPGFGNDVASLCQRAKDPRHCVLREENEDGAASLDLSQFEFLFTVFDVEDDTSSTTVRALARQLAAARGTADNADEERQKAKVALEQMIPPRAVDLVVEYYGNS